MQPSIRSDPAELKKCNAHKYGLRFKSYKKGYASGKIDAQRNHSTKNEEKRAENPYTIPPDVLLLLQKRARWEMGYEMGWQTVLRKRTAKLPVKKKKK